MVRIGKNTPNETKKQIINLLKEYRDVLAFTYDELKFYKGDVLQHTIPLREGGKPIRKKLRQINPKLDPLVKAKLEKSFATKIIAPTRYSSWCSNLVVVRKKMVQSDYVWISKI